MQGADKPLVYMRECANSMLVIYGETMVFQRLKNQRDEYFENRNGRQACPEVHLIYAMHLQL